MSNNFQRNTETQTYKEKHVTKPQMQTPSVKRDRHAEARTRERATHRVYERRGAKIELMRENSYLK